MLTILQGIFRIHMWAKYSTATMGLTFITGSPRCWHHQPNLSYVLAMY